MASEKQKKANAKNSQLSTGPITPAGKAKIAKNATKHGIFSKELLIQTGDGKEDINEYKKLLEGLRTDFSPQGMMEALLVEKLAVNYWRLRRVIRYETGELRIELDDYKKEVIDRYLKPAYNSEESQPRTLEYLSYNSNVSDEEIHEKASLVATLMNPETDLTKNDFVLEYILINTFEHEYIEVSEEDLNKARKFIQKLSIDEKEELRVEVLEQEWEYLGEMKRVRDMNDKFDRISRIRSLPRPDDLDKIIKYETALERSIHQNLAILTTLHKRRIKVIDVNTNENQ
ncbi:MAG: hypothetical protein IH886_04380 [Nitrospinae bacterium]|nr:hypothetical protein [Nitrospinota bacterium]